MTDEEFDKRLENLYKRYTRLLVKASNDRESETVYGYISRFQKAIDGSVLDFKAQAREFVDKGIPAVNMKKSSAEVLREAGAIYDTANVKFTTYVQIVASLTNSANGYKDRINAYITEREKSGEVVTVGELREHIREELKSGGALAVVYQNGAQMPVAKYSAMLARTTRAETANIAMIGKALDDGNDLVECSRIDTTCPLCAVVQGRIYSISGKNPNYPALYKTAFKSGYSVIHPNCRHTFFPYNPKFHTEEEREELETATRRSWQEDTADRHFQQTKSASEQYARGQSLMRQWNAELNAFQAYREYCVENGIEPRYTTLGGFRRAYRADEGTEAYKNAHFYRANN